jgi:hypothetical protein
MGEDKKPRHIMEVRTEVKRIRGRSRGTYMDYIEKIAR